MPESTLQCLKKGQIEKLIWGHRLYDEQTGMMTLLELLCVLDCLPLSDPANACMNRLKDYQAPARRLLRSLVFNNPYIDELRAEDEDEWRLWKERFNKDKQTQDLCGKSRESPDADLITDGCLESLQNLFSSDSKGFHAFSDAIRLLRSSGINRTSNKRWTSYFLFPWGRHCLYLDLNAKGRTDRRFFARNGELLYLLLSHAGRRVELDGLFQKKVLDSGHDLDTVCKALSLGCDDLQKIAGASDSEGCQLPSGAAGGSGLNPRAQCRVDILCEDLITALSLPIPAPDALLHAARITMLNLLCYFLEQARLAIEAARSLPPESRPVPLLCEALQKASSDLRRCSRNLFKKHDGLSLDAVQAFYEAHAAGSPAPRISPAAKPGDYDEEDEEGSNPGGQDSLESVLANHKNHWAGIHRAFAKDCGLASNLCTRDYRYCPSDALLETLAAILMPGQQRRLLLSDFLRKAYSRYGLVFREAECKGSGLAAAEQLDNAELKANQGRLMRRLEALGLLSSLSDGFEFVLNPYART